MPTRLDADVLHSLSGATRGQLISGLRFLGLLGKSGDVKTEYKSLVEARKASETEYQAAMLKILTAAYQPIVGNINIERGTLAELETAFRSAGVPQGQMLTKTVRFYIRALTDCAVKVSPYITKPRQRKTSGKTNAAKPPKKTTKNQKLAEKPPGGQPSRTDQIPDGFERLPIPMLSDAFIQYPVSLTAAQCALLEGAVVLLRTSVEINTKEGTP